MSAPWAAIAQQIAGHITRGTTGLLQRSVAKRQLKVADQMSRMGLQLGAIEFVMEKRRQEAGQQAMTDTLAAIDEAYGEADTPEARTNRAIIRKMVSNLGAAAVSDAASVQKQREGTQARRTRRVLSSRGTGGSAAQSMIRDLVRARTEGREAVRDTREATERGVETGLRKKRASERAEARDLGDVTGFQPISAREKMMTALGTQSAAEQERFRHIPGMLSRGLSGTARAVGSLYDVGTAYQEGYEEHQLEKEQRADRRQQLRELRAAV